MQTPPKAGFSSNTPIYDLDDQQFETQQWGKLTLSQLQDACVGTQVRLSASWLEGPVARNMTRCIASIHPRDGRVSILETASYSIHRPKDLAPRTISEGAMERLTAMRVGGMTAEQKGPVSRDGAASETSAGVTAADGMGELTNALVRDYAFCAGEQRCVMPLRDGAEGAMSMANFRMLMQPHAVEVVGPRGGLTGC